MSPKRIILVRHGESEGNVDKAVHKTKPDFALTLTPKGVKQAAARGVELKRILGSDSVFFYVSPFWRARETFAEIIRAFDPSQFQAGQDPRIREQEFAAKPQISNFDDSQERDKAPHFYYRYQGGEAPCNVFDRVSSFIESLIRDFNNPDFPDNCVIVSHGMLMRLFLMRWLGLSVEEFELLKNPHNCEAITLIKQAHGRYTLERPLAKWDSPRHAYQYLADS